MYKFIMTLLLFSIWTSTVYSKDLLFSNDGSASGITGQFAKIFANDLEKEGYSVDIKNTNNNCALSRFLWDQSKIPSLFILSNVYGSTNINNKNCFIPIKQEQMMYWIYSSPYVFCSAGNKTWQDFLIPNSTHTVAIHTDNNSEKLFEEISKFYNVKIKTIKLESSVHLIPMIKSKELDFVFWNTVSQIEDIKDKCIWAAGTDQKLPNGSKYLSKLNIDLSVFVVDVYIVGKNILTQDKEKILRAIQNGWNNQETQKIFTRRNFDNNIVSFQDKKEYDDKMKYLWNLMYNKK